MTEQSRSYAQDQTCTATLLRYDITSLHLSTFVTLERRRVHLQLAQRVDAPQVPGLC